MKRLPLQVAAVIAFITVIRAVLSLELELTSVESYLWVCAQRPALGYFDYPGMIAWMGWVSTSLFGHGALGVRLLTILGGAAMVWVIFLAARRLYDERVAALAAVMAALVPDFLMYAAYATPDAPCLLFWSATIWALAHALSGDSPRWWYLAGLFLGLAMDSKYHAVFLGFGVFGFLVLSPDQRGWLKRKEPWLAVVVALAAFSPTILWNARNGWQSFAYQGVSRFKESGFNPRELWEYPVSQLLLLTPAIAAWAWACGIRTLLRWRAADWRDRFLAALGVPILIFFFLVILSRPVRGHWPLPGYVAALILSASAVAKGAAWGRRLHVGSLAILAAGYALAAVLVPVVIPAEQRRGWAALADAVATRRADFVVCNEYHLASQMAYQLRSSDAWETTPLGRPTKNYPNWWDPGPYRGKNAVVIVEAKKSEWIRSMAVECFERVDPPERVSVPRVEVVGRQDKKKDYEIFRAWNYRGPKTTERRFPADD